MATPNRPAAGSSGQERKEPKVSKPNSQRHRINVDVGYRVYWLLTELISHVRPDSRRKRWTTVSDLVREAVERFAEEKLPVDVYGRAPLREPLVDYRAILRGDGAGQGASE